jgi:4-aminobutyrate aminotransferase/(S)-3-amino-2-methylpropionate transaminase
MFATDYWAEYGVYADLMTSAKSIAAGLPISAVTGREEIMEATLPGELGGTYGGNPLACASALKVLEIFERDNYAGKAMEMNKKLMSRFEKWYDQFDFIGEYRGVGAMAAIEFVKDRGTKEPNPELVNKIMAECKQKGLVVKNAGVYGQVIRFLAPLCITDAQLEAGLDILEDAMKKFTE